MANTLKPQRYWQAMVALIVSALAMGFAWQMIVARIQHDLQERFGFESQLITSRVSERLSASALVLRGAAGFVSANSGVSRSAWQRYIWEMNLEQMSGVQMVGFVRHVPAPRLDAFQREVRHDGYADFSVKPAGPRASYASVQFAEPLTGRNREALGADLSVVPELERALQAARDSGVAVFSGKLMHPVWEGDEQRAAVMAFYPVFYGREVPKNIEQRRELLQGWVCTLYRLQDLMGAVLNQQLPGIRLEIFDGDGLVQSTLLFDSHAGQSVDPYEGMQLPAKISRLQFEGREWTLRYTALANYGESVRFDAAWVIMFGMIIISVLLGGMTWVAVNTRERAQSIAARLTATLRSSEERYRSIFGQAGVTALLVDPHTRQVVEANAAASNYYGIAAVDMREMSLDRIVVLDELSLSGALAEAFRGQRSRMFQQHRLKSGQVREVEVHTSQMALDGRELLYCVVHDVTERHEAENAVLELNQRYQSLLDAASEVSIIATDRAGLITLFNRGAERLLGYRATEVVERMSLLAFHVQQELQQRGQVLSTDLGYPIAGLQALVEVPLAHGSEQREWGYVRRDGSHCRVSLSMTPVRALDGSVAGYLAIALDISRLKEVEASLVQARDAAEQASRAKSAFLATMSHEIRTPMNGVIGMAQLLQQTKLSEEQSDYAAVIMSSAESLLTIINDILDFSKVEAGKLSIEQVPLELRRVVNDVAAILSPQAQARNLAVTLHIDDAVPQWVLGDPVRLRQILVNLMGNAIKFTHHGGINVRISSASPGGLQHTQLRLSVSDTGVGMPPSVVKGLFTPFYQGDSSVTRRFGGTGLGLSITQGLVELMGGRIEVASVEGQGSTFDVMIELAVPEQMPETLDTPLWASLPAGARILVVDDTPTNQKVALQMLHKLGLDAVTASNGEEALHTLAAPGATFDLVLMDCQMPVLDGYAATERIRAGAAGKQYLQLPIIAMTANAVAGDRERCLAAGMSDYLPKPVVFEELSRLLRQWLTGVAASKEATGSSVIPKLSMASQPVFDPKDLMNNSGNDRDLALAIIDAGLSDLPDFMIKLEQARHEKNLDAALRLSHTLKGLAAQLSAKHMTGLAQRMEQQAKQGELPSVEQISALTEAHRHLLTALEKFCQEG